MEWSRPARRRATALLLLVAGCGRVDRPAAPRETTLPSARETAQCHADLRREGVDFRVLPDRDYGGGCGVHGAVQLLDIGVPVTGVTAMRCGTARAFAGWIRNAVAPGAYQMLGSELARVEGMGSYACRHVVGSVRNAGRLSGHAVANAVDVGGFVLNDGRRVTVLRDWNGPDAQARDFLRAVHRSACRRFGTVLSPGYNAAHANHLHLEDDRTGFCR
jgi:hypothetical protein